MTIKEIIAAKEARKKELTGKLAAATTVEEIRSITLDGAAIDNEIAELRTAQETMEAEARASQEVLAQAVKDGHATLNAQGTYQFGEQRTEANKFDTMEYRTAFMKFMQTGNMAPEYRDTTGASDVGYVVPLTTMNEVVKKLTVYGNLYRRVRHLNVTGGLTIPLITLKPVATWIGDVGSSTSNKQTAGGVSFTYYGLECKISQSLLVNIAAVPAFESALVELIVEAINRALDVAIANGTGVTGKQPLGITQDVAVTKIITLSAADFASWEAWKKKVFAKMPAAYKASAVFVMASGTWEGYIDGMVDANGQPVGRMNYGIADGPQQRFGGREVIEVEDDVVKNYDDAAVGDVVAIYGNLNNYAINSNMALTVTRYKWEETNEWIDKGILIADGKVVDPNGFVVVKKG